MRIDEQLNELVQYALKKQLIDAEDLIYCKNQVMEVLGVKEALSDVRAATFPDRELQTILDDILDWAVSEGQLKDTVTERDLLDTKLMAVFMDKPSQVVKEFNRISKVDSVVAATAWFYEINKDIHYIRRDRIAKNVSWATPTDYGDLDITINLSKPEKDPAEIAAAKKAASSNYPLCLLCKENVGYEGRLNHPARQNLRTIPVEMNKEEWHLQFSPYVYYHEHAIVLSAKHEPMKITEQTFERLLDFCGEFQHYFIGSNADLPIVGGSILSHDHYQAGKYEFPMARAENEETESLVNFGDVSVSKIKWPMSVLRVKGSSKQEVVRASEMVRQKWQHYSDESVGVHAFSDETPHNTITPIARYRNNKFEIDLVLRNNRTSDEHPMGIFHPHEEVHHIKKENIGLIEVMGLAVLPGRLKEEIRLLTEAVLTDNPEKAIAENEEIAKHLDWAMQLLSKYDHLTLEKTEAILQQEIGKVFATILSHAGVFKRDQEGQNAFLTFMESLKEAK
ncbi:UDP-glucose--hexose-1-phosphate uridylyltransferase [Salipaludibacillus neizhouensis]|uniref:Galactose-1-phosphate uridylyltransferase n=1 Tax=Salipaludibacillus neizhouensis TaxID=885475 RepID=A0A3A9K9Y0_9BACI|nr:UDP-glucose--hexose-1-phosphate uridylyltransferase [Salipaludibacillus neizhouensis]RKL66443.1 UDP-glucose--hexose-1-phosphate uridylyltransferase [Salipaludibacillus neizhouensis]